MNKLSIKTIIVQPSQQLLCITTSGEMLTLTDPVKTSWLLAKAIPMYAQYPDCTLEVDLEDITNTKLFECNGTEVVLTDNSIAVGDKTYSLETDSLIRFIDYAETNKYNITPLIEKITSALEQGNNESTKDLLTFLSKNELPITVKGNVLAFKVVDNKGTYFTDVHTKCVKQNVGDVVSMPREMVATDRSVHCSTGLHVCSIDYIKDFYIGNCQSIILVKVDPKDICSVPNDTSAKVRCCKYQILGCIEQDEVKSILSKDISNAPMFQKLLDDAINERFYGVNKNLTLQKPTVTDESTILSLSMNDFHLMDFKAKKPKEVELVNDKEDLSKDLVNLAHVIPHIKTLINDTAKFDTYSQTTQEQVLKQILSHKKHFTWASMGIDRNTAKRILTRCKKHGLI